MSCNSCEKNTDIKAVPYVVHEAEMARRDRHDKRMWILVIIAWLVTLSIIGISTYERLQYDYSSEEVIVEQDAQDGGNANYIGNDGEIVNGLPESDNKKAETD